MTFILSFLIAVFFSMATGVSLECRFIAMAIILAGGLAGLGGK